MFVKAGNICYYDVPMLNSLDGIIYLILPNTMNIKNLIWKRYNCNIPKKSIAIFGPNIRTVSAKQVCDFHTMDEEEVLGQNEYQEIPRYPIKLIFNGKK